jgi:hypothetical protein
MVVPGPDKGRSLDRFVAVVLAPRTSSAASPSPTACSEFKKRDKPESSSYNLNEPALPGVVTFIRAALPLESGARRG